MQIYTQTRTRLALRSAEQKTQLTARFGSTSNAVFVLLFVCLLIFYFVVCLLLLLLFYEGGGREGRFLCVSSQENLCDLC